MRNNEEILEKAVITATDALASAGKLNPVQADQFIDYVMDQTAWTANSRLVRFRGESFDVDKIGLGARNAMPAAEAQDPGLRRGVTTSKISLSPKEIMVPFEIGDSFKELAIEENVEDHIIQMMARAVANDLEELYINGNALGPAALESSLVGGGSSSNFIKDSYLGLFDGWLKLADSGNVLDAAGADLTASLLSDMIRQLPSKFRRDRRNLRFIMSADMAQIWREKVSARATSLGDDALQSEGMITAFGIPVVEVPLFPFQPTTVEHITSTGATATMSLAHQKVSNVVVTDSALGSAPEPAFTSGGTDYSVNLTNGTISNVAAGNWGDSAVAKVTYSAPPMILLSHLDNFLVGMSRDIRIERDRDIFRRVNQYAISVKVACEIEETDALVKAKNLGTA